MLKTRQGVTVTNGKTRRFVRIREVVALTGLPPSSVYAAMAAGKFPQSIPLGPKTRAWSSDEIEAWQDECIAARNR